MDKPNLAIEQLPPAMQTAVKRLHNWEQKRRWVLVILLWLLLFPVCLLLLHYPIRLLLEYFTWSGVRYGLAFNPIPAAGLLLTILLTCSSLISQWFYQTYGLTSTEVRRLQKRATRIQARGESHPLWLKVWG